MVSAAAQGLRAGLVLVAAAGAAAGASDGILGGSGEALALLQLQAEHTQHVSSLGRRRRKARHAAHGRRRRPRKHVVGEELVHVRDGSGASRLAPKRNVLFLLVDDLRPNLGAYNFSMASTPNIDWIAKDGLTFSRAYANFPWCAPSRNSFLSGRLPDTTRDFNFVDHFREKGIGKDWKSLPQYFKEHGYTTATSGKFFHKTKPPNNDYPLSWTLKPFTPYCNPPECLDSTATFGSNAYDGRHRCIEKGWSWCAMDIPKDEDRDKMQLEDQRVAASCISQLRQVASDPSKPFFLGCGFYKPHAPWIFPAEFLKQLPANIDDIPLPKHGEKPEGMPHAAFHGVMDIKVDLGGDDNATDLDTVNRYNRRAYYASVLYIDHLIGKVLGALRKAGVEDNTVILLTSDHGWHLGEQGIWGKMTNFEHSLRVPLVVRAPWIEASRGRTTSALAELVDLYRTLAALAGLPDPHSVGEHVNGTSLLPVFEDPSKGKSVKLHAFSQVAKPSVENPNFISVSMRRNETQIMGYSLRSDEWRYTVWFKMDTAEQVPITGEGGIIGAELYDHREDGRGGDGGNGGFDSCQEMKNVIGHYSATAQKLHGDLLRKIRLFPIGGKERFWPEEGLTVALAYSGSVVGGRPHGLESVREPSPWDQLLAPRAASRPVG